MTDQTDLFGQGLGQASLFGSGDDRMQAPQRDVSPDPDSVRARLRAVLDKARTADSMPWSERDARMWQTVFPNMAAWLPDDEAEQLRLDFRREIERLSQAG